LEPADRLTRLIAAFLDGIVFGAMVYLPALIVLLATGAISATADTQPSVAVLGLSGLLCLAGLVAWIWITIKNVAATGQTIAKRMLDIRVVRRDGSQASLGRIFWLRNVVNGLLGIIPLYGIIDLLFIFGEERLCLHDKVADTMVVKV
jgi:uncharacterized RDD family membrane protein YckC